MNETQNAVMAATTPQQAMLELAVSLDRLHAKIDEPSASVDPWGAWDKSLDTDGEVVDDKIPDQYPGSERHEQRLKFATNSLQLAGPEAVQYAMAGPLHVYLNDRELVMQYPMAIRRLMVQDVELDSPKDAQEMSRDILKSTEAGMVGGVMMAEGNVG